ncbi:MAG: SDR family oxidoreductase [Acidobacteria bacterium ACB1]|nr:putative oxidoreductase [Pyrinomonadaceae bacterium]MCE7962142.1 SDR family oxidoreductase [Acidobacteria bacterium ACB1]RIJ92708.1 MAG: short-chain dehydrogenase [Acidobacteriota bacterium]
MEKIEGKVAIVTGATKGIGYAIAESLVKNGAKAFICGRSKSDVTKAVANLSACGEAAGEPCDVRSEDQVRQMIEQAARVFGGVDILVNSAGVGFNGTTVEETSGDIFRQTLETNLFGMFYACHYAIPLMKQRGGGYIINISSLMGQYAQPKAAAYNASKFGVNGFTEALMQEVRADNIKVTGICPGSVNTYFGGDTPSDEKAWQLQPADIGEVVLDLFRMDERVLPSRIELRPSKPPRK